MCLKATVAQRVSFGGQMLDRKFPGWERSIDLDRARTTSYCDCVLGQLFGFYTIGRRRLGLSDQEAQRAGFYPAVDLPSAEAILADCDALDVCWKAEIERRCVPVAA